MKFLSIRRNQVLSIKLYNNKLNVYCRGKILGDIEAMNLNEYLFTLRCRSIEGELLRISKEDFLKKICSNNMTKEQITTNVCNTKDLIKRQLINILSTVHYLKESSEKRKNVLPSLLGSTTPQRHNFERNNKNYKFYMKNKLIKFNSSYCRFIARTKRFSKLDIFQKHIPISKIDYNQYRDKSNKFRSKIFSVNGIWTSPIHKYQSCPGKSGFSKLGKSDIKNLKY